LLGSRRLTIAKDLRFCLLFMQSFRFILVIISFLIFVDARICVRDIATVVIPILCCFYFPILKLDTGTLGKVLGPSFRGTELGQLVDATAGY